MYRRGKLPTQRYSAPASSASSSYVATLPKQQLAHRPRPRRAPFVGTSIEEYTSKYWCVTFTLMRYAYENREMQRFCNWYAVRTKVVYLDYLPFGAAKIREQITQRMRGNTELPVLFVNKKCVGSLPTLRKLEDSARLKDVLHFGFLWSTRPDSPSPDVNPQALPTPPSFYGDDEMFRGKYRGAPVAAPVVQLPKFMPRDSILHGHEGDN